MVPDSERWRGGIDARMLTLEREVAFLDERAREVDRMVATLQSEMAEMRKAIENAAQTIADSQAASQRTTVKAFEDMDSRRLSWVQLAVGALFVLFSSAVSGLIIAAATGSLG